MQGHLNLAVFIFWIRGIIINDAIYNIFNTVNVDIKYLLNILTKTQILGF